MKYGTPLFALQELGGWESAEMVRRYAHLAADHLAPYAERLCAARVMESEPRHVLAVAKTARACRRQALDWLRGQDLNLRPSGYEGAFWACNIVTNQTLVALAKHQTCLIKAQFGHSPLGLVTTHVKGHCIRCANNRVSHRHVAHALKEKI